MRKFVIFLSLVALLALPLVAENKIQFSFSGFGGQAFLGSGYEWRYQYELYAEIATVSEKVTVRGSQVFGGTIGVIVTPQIEIFGFFGTMSKTWTGTYSITIPHDVYFDWPATDSAETDVNFRSTVFGVGVNYYFTNKAVRPYFGVSLGSSTIKVDALEDIHYTGWEIWLYDWYWGVYYLDDWGIEIDQFKHKELSQSGLVFEGRMGLMAHASPKIATYVEAKYVSSKRTFDVPIVESLGGEKSFDIQAGGFQIVAGLKFVF